MLKFMGATALWFPLSMYKAFAVMKLFNWHAVPSFGIAQLDFLYAWGVSTMVALLVMHKPHKDDDSDIIESAVFSIVATTMYLAMGYTITLFQ